MVNKRVEEFHIHYFQVLDEKGNVDKKLMPKLSSKQITDMYYYMKLSRAFDDKALKLQRQGKIGTFAQIKGQEGIQIGASFAMQKQDWLVPAFREWAAHIVLGVPMDKILQGMAGDERGNTFPGKILPMSVPVGTHMLHAAGIGMALNLQKKKEAIVTYFGDGATSEGDFHEAMNFAGVYKVPLVFICQNNKYAISLPVEQQTRAKTMAQKAIAYGFEGVQIDGNDPFASYKVAKYALDKARAGKGPTLIEAITYRMANHTTADDYTKYRSEKEVKSWEPKDPILRLKLYMKKNKLWSDSKEKELDEKITKEVEDAVKKAQSVKPAPKEDIFKYMYEKPTKEILDQMKDG
tara:strand:- start:2931 stop:3980 length:1050 start_codon:yes stop_codon:yes gene_type:complete